jgi:hypothetical protein
MSREKEEEMRGKRELMENLVIYCRARYCFRGSQVQMLKMEDRRVL